MAYFFRGIPAGAMTILVVEDEKKVSSLIRKGLEEEEYAVEVAQDGEKGFQLASTGRYDLLILDVMLPRKDGFTIVRDLRAAGTMTPVLMLTARTSTDDKVQGLDSGADDYLTKPFAFEELLARVRSLLRRGALDRAGVLAIADLELDPVTRKARRAGRSIDLTAKEFALLEFFLRNKERVLTRAAIAEKIWDYTFDTGTNIIDVYINHLRNKIDSGFDRKLIHTVRGVGYLLKED
jgi:heavy metal response regulator